jgi:carbamoyltransferase
MKVLGYSGGIDGYPSRFSTSHDAAAALVIDGQVVAACEEERFSREKHTGAFPTNAIEYCLRAGGLRDLSQLSLICFYHSFSQMFRPEMLEQNRARMRVAPRLAFAAMLETMRTWNRWTGYTDHRSRRVFTQRSGFDPAPGNYRVIPHHLCHTASAFYPSPFDEALCLTLDAQGESASAMLAIGQGSQIKVLKQLFAPNSIGYLYSCMTTYLGFDRADEFKVMGLAPYGDPARFRAFFDKAMQSGDDGSFAIDPNLISWLIVRDALCPAGALYPWEMTRALGQARLKGEPIEQRHSDIAASLQEATERVVMRMLEQARADTGQRNLCLAGGVALNCTMNGKIARSGLFDRVWVQPASHDAGAALGAALYGHHVLLGAERQATERAAVYLGPEHPMSSMGRAILEYAPEIRCRRPADVSTEVARAIAEGRVVAWYQGRGEWGPRALGNRSILADPRRTDMKDRVNSVVKMREGYRPFAPACLREHADQWFDLRGVGESPYMLFAVPVREGKRAEIPAVTHVDGSARVQTLREEENPRFYALIRAFYELTGVPILLNTSFNVNSEPIVNTPAEAIRCFLGTGIDLLVLGDTVIEKRADVARRAGAAKRPEPLWPAAAAVRDAMSGASSARSIGPEVG